MKAGLDILRRLLQGGVSISWTFDLGPKPHDTVEERGFWSRLLAFRIPGPRAAEDSQGPPSPAAHDLPPKPLVEVVGFSPAPTPEKEAMGFPKVFPGAEKRYCGAVKVMGDFQGSLPQGVTVHYSADRDLSRTISALDKRSLGYHLIIERDGTVFQIADLTGRLWHAGKAIWNGRSPNQTHLSIALLSWGWLKERAPGAYESWNGMMVPTSDVARRRGQWWDKATAEQEASLRYLLEWLALHGIPIADMCGHDECALPSGRKSDPGGVLELTMGEMRAALLSPAAKV